MLRSANKWPFVILGRENERAFPKWSTTPPLFVHLPVDSVTTVANVVCQQFDGVCATLAASATHVTKHRG